MLGKAIADASGKEESVAKAKDSTEEANDESKVGASTDQAAPKRLKMSNKNMRSIAHRVFTTEAVEINSGRTPDLAALISRFCCFGDKVCTGVALRFCASKTWLDMSTFPYPSAHNLNISLPFIDSLIQLGFGNRKTDLLWLYAFVKKFWAMTPEKAEWLLSVVAARVGSLDMTQWIHHKWPELDLTDACDLAASGGWIELITWLRSKGVDVREKTAQFAGLGGHLNVLKYISEENLPWNPKEVFRVVSSGKPHQAPVRKWMLKIASKYPHIQHAINSVLGIKKQISTIGDGTGEQPVELGDSSSEERTVSEESGDEHISEGKYHSDEDTGRFYTGHPESVLYYQKDYIYAGDDENHYGVGGAFVNTDEKVEFVVDRYIEGDELVVDLQRRYPLISMNLAGNPSHVQEYDTVNNAHMQQNIGSESMQYQHNNNIQFHGAKVNIIPPLTMMKHDGKGGNDAPIELSDDEPDEIENEVPIQTSTNHENVEVSDDEPDIVENEVAIPTDINVPNEGSTVVNEFVI